MSANDAPPLMTPNEAANYLKVKARTLEKWRHKGTGPAYHKLGERCIRYALSDLQEWLQGLSKGSTHDQPNQQ